MKKITLKNVLTLMMLIAVVFLTTNCKSSKQTSATQQSVTDNDPNLVKRYCYGPEFFSDSEYIRGSGIGTSASQDMADKKALSSARSKIAASIETLVKAVNETYGESMSKNGVEDLSEDYKTMTREVIKQKLSNVVIICNKMTEENNNYTSYIALQLNGEDLVNAIGARLSKDDKTQINFDKFQYRKIFDEEMDKYEEQKNR